MDDRAGGRRVPPNTPVAAPFSRLSLVCEPGLTPVADAICRPGVAELYERHVVDALQAVEPRERECIELRYIDGLSVDEVAARCEMSAIAVDDRLRRGLNDMLRYLRACARRESVARR